MAIRANFEYLVAEQVPDQAPAYFFLDILPDQIEGFTAEAKSVEGVGEVAHTASLRGRIVSINDVPAEKITPAPNVAWVLRGDRGLTYRRMPPEGSAIVEGTWWPDDYSGPPLISMGLEAAKGLGVEVGDHMTLNILGREITAEVSNLRRIDWSSFGINFVLIFSPGLLESAPHTFIATATADVNAELALEKAVTGKYRNVTAIRVRDALETVNSILENISVAVRATASVSLLAGTLVLAGAVAAGHRRRVYDAVVLKVLGATRADIIGAYLLEYLILGLIVAILAAVVGTLSAYFIVTEFMGGRWYFPPGTIAATMAICMSITVSAGIIATFAVLGQKPAPLLRNE
jgi:putative ABC transport system permease protein